MNGLFPRVSCHPSVLGFELACVHCNSVTRSACGLAAAFGGGWIAVPHYHFAALANRDLRKLFERCNAGEERVVNVVCLILHDTLDSSETLGAPDTASASNNDTS